MSDFARLKEKLAKLRKRERASGEGRKLKGSNSDALLASLVTEIDETILPRRLTLTKGKISVHLAVANRRLQALLGPVPKIKGASDLDGKELPDAEDPGVPALRDVLVAFFDGARSVSVTARRLDVSFGSDIGVPSNMLGRAWGIETTSGTKPLEPSEILAEFLSGLESHAVAWLRIEGEEVTDQSGDEGRLVDLGEQAALFLDGYFAKFEEIFPPDAFACGTVVAAKEGEAMFFAEIGEISAFVVVEAEKVAAVAQRWQGLVAE